MNVLRIPWCLGYIDIIPSASMLPCKAVSSQYLRIQSAETSDGVNTSTCASGKSLYPSWEIKGHWQQFADNTLVKHNRPSKSN